MDSLALARVRVARGRLLSDHPWFGALSLRLKLAEGECARMDTDGTYIRYNPVWLLKQPDRNVETAVAHETLHCALLHPFRCAGLDPLVANQAGDYVVNGLLRREGFHVPAGWLDDPRFDGLDLRTVYARLMRDKQPPQPGGQGQGEDPTFSPAPTPQPGSEVATATDWIVATEHASMTMKRADKLPGDTARAARAARETGVPWRDALREFCERSLPTDFSWTSPSRRFAWQGIYLPGIVREGWPGIGLAVDMSGSISKAELAMMAAAATEILRDLRPDHLDVAMFDTKVRATRRFFPDGDEVELRARAGGGTRFQPTLDWFSEMPEGPPACLVFITDLASDDAPTAPDYPVLWVTPAGNVREPPFGSVARMF